MKNTTAQPDPDNKNPLALAAPASAELAAMTPAAVLAQVALIQEIMQATMKDGEHFGRIPGCGDKSVLLKPGAEKLCFTFRLAPTYEIAETNFAREHREYRITCTLSSILTGTNVGQGLGTCSTLESKYRFRKGNAEATDSPVPRAYWDLRADDPQKAQQLIGGKGYSVKKVDGKGWMIAKGGEQVEHDNPADNYNTVLKMAKKRALVDAVLTATAASDIFTQDLDDIRDAQTHFAPPPDDPPAAPVPAPAPERPRPVAPAGRPAAASVPEGQHSGNLFGEPVEASTPRKTASPVSEPVTVDVEPAGTDPGATAKWRGVRVHFGKNAGQPLSALRTPQIEWYLRDWLPKNEAAGQQGKEDRSLCAALREWEKCNTLLNAIGCKCEAKGFPEQTVADHVRERTDSGLKTLAEYPEATLRMILDGFDAIAAEIVAHAG